MTKRVICIFLIITFALTSISVCFGHDRSGHDADIEYVLFGEENYKNSHPLVSDIVQALEDATYLCVDQFNGEGEKELRNLLDKEKIPGIIKSIDEINYTSNYSHRSLTHRGWNMSYDEKAHWPLRQTILINTVKKELFSDESLWTRLPWVENKYSDKQIESFCVLLYYTHVLGDHLEAGEEKKVGKGETGEKTLQEKLNGIAYIAPLVRPNDNENPGVIPDLITYLDILFEEQKETSKHTYDAMIQELKNLEAQSRSLVGSTGGVNTEEKFAEYNNCAKELRDVLGTYVPMLLKKETYFKDIFYGQNAA